MESGADNRYQGMTTTTTTAKANSGSVVESIIEHTLGVLPPPLQRRGSEIVVAMAAAWKPTDRRNRLANMTDRANTKPGRGEPNGRMLPTHCDQSTDWPAVDVATRIRKSVQWIRHSRSSEFGSSLSAVQFHWLVSFVGRLDPVDLFSSRLALIHVV